MNVEYDETPNDDAGLLKPSATVNTGDNPGELTAPRVTLDD